MSVGVRRALGAAVALAAVLGVGVLSRAPYAAGRTDHAVLRLAWRARGERIEECRRLTADELARLPAHMRQDERCEGRILPYRLHVTLDGTRAVDELVHAAGARHDRPLYVFREVPLPPGTHPVVVTFAAEGDVPPGAREEEHGTPRRLVLDTAVVFAPAEVVLVTYDDERRRLVVKRAAER